MNSYHPSNLTTKGDSSTTVSPLITAIKTTAAQFEGSESLRVMTATLITQPYLVHLLPGNSNLKNQRVFITNQQKKIRSLRQRIKRYSSYPSKLRRFYKITKGKQDLMRYQTSARTSQRSSQTYLSVSSKSYSMQSRL